MHEFGGYWELSIGKLRCIEQVSDLKHLLLRIARLFPIWCVYYRDGHFRDVSERKDRGSDDAILHLKYPRLAKSTEDGGFPRRRPDLVRQYIQYIERVEMGETASCESTMDQSPERVEFAQQLPEFVSFFSEWLGEPIPTADDPEFRTRLLSVYSRWLHWLIEKKYLGKLVGLGQSHTTLATCYRHKPPPRFQDVLKLLYGADPESVKGCIRNALEYAAEQGDPFVIPWIGECFVELLGEDIDDNLVRSFVAATLVSVHYFMENGWGIPITGGRETVLEDWHSLIEVFVHRSPRMGDAVCEAALEIALRSQNTFGLLSLLCALPAYKCADLVRESNDIAAAVLSEIENPTTFDGIEDWRWQGLCEVLELINPSAVAATLTRLVQDGIEDRDDYDGFILNKVLHERQLHSFLKNAHIHKSPLFASVGDAFVARYIKDKDTVPGRYPPDHKWMWIVDVEDNDNLCLDHLCKDDREFEGVIRNAASKENEEFALSVMSDNVGTMPLSALLRSELKKTMAYAIENDFNTAELLNALMDASRKHMQPNA